MKDGILSIDRVPFTQIANSVLSSPELSMQAKGLFSYIYSKPNDWQFSYKRIVNEMKDGEYAVLRTLKELEKSGHLKRTRQPNGRVSYYITFKPDRENHSQAQEAKLRFPQVGETTAISNKELNTTNKEGSTPRLSREDLIESFSIFWGAYPRKVAKPMALRAWLKIKPSIELTERILQGVRNHQAGKQWQEEGGRFIPHPATFLNQQRWEDEVEEKQNLSVLHL